LTPSLFAEDARSASREWTKVMMFLKVGEVPALPWNDAAINGE